MLEEAAVLGRRGWLRCVFTQPKVERDVSERLIMEHLQIHARASGSFNAVVPEEYPDGVPRHGLQALEGGMGIPANNSALVDAMIGIKGMY
jgi:hypothetical protein